MTRSLRVRLRLAMTDYPSCGIVAPALGGTRAYRYTRNDGVKRHTWDDIKTRTKPEIRTRIEAEAHRLSDGLRSEAKPQRPHSKSLGRGDLREPARDSD